MGVSLCEDPPVRLSPFGFPLAAYPSPIGRDVSRWPTCMSVTSRRDHPAGDDPACFWPRRPHELGVRPCGPIGGARPIWSPHTAPSRGLSSRSCHGVHPVSSRGTRPGWPFWIFARARWPDTSDRWRGQSVGRGRGTNLVVDGDEDESPPGWLFAVLPSSGDRRREKGGEERTQRVASRSSGSKMRAGLFHPVPRAMVLHGVRAQSTFGSSAVRADPDPVVRQGIAMDGSFPISISRSRTTRSTGIVAVARRRNGLRFRPARCLGFRRLALLSVPRGHAFRTSHVSGDVHLRMLGSHPPSTRRHPPVPACASASASPGSEPPARTAPARAAQPGRSDPGNWLPGRWGRR